MKCRVPIIDPRDDIDCGVDTPSRVRDFACPDIERRCTLERTGGPRFGLPLD